MAVRFLVYNHRALAKHQRPLSYMYARQLRPHVIGAEYFRWGVPFDIKVHIVYKKLHHFFYDVIIRDDVDYLFEKLMSIPELKYSSELEMFFQPAVERTPVILDRAELIIRDKDFATMFKLQAQTPMIQIK